VAKPASVKFDRATLLENLRKNDRLSFVIDRNQKLFASYVIFLLIYAVFSLLPEPSAITMVRYHLGATDVRLIDLTVIILLAAIWGVGFYGYARLRNYAQMVKKQKDGKHIAAISWGVLFLVLWLPISEDVSAVLSFMTTHYPHWLGAVTIINNYLNLLIPFAGFIFISLGARRLRGLVKQDVTHYLLNLAMLVIAYAGIIYAHLVASTADRTIVYHLSLWLILLTIVAPYLYMWLIGVVAAYDIYHYQRGVKGIIYKQSWNLLASGCGWLIATSIIFQFFAAIFPHLNKLSIYGLLVIVYSLLLVLSFGFILIASGAAKLQRIEEV
jgi:hypothetical protein